MRPTTNNKDWKKKVKSSGKCRITVKGNTCSVIRNFGNGKYFAYFDYDLDKYVKKWQQTDYHCISAKDEYEDEEKFFAY